MTKSGKSKWIRSVAAAITLCQLGACKPQTSERPRDQTIIMASPFGEEFTQAAQELGRRYTQRHAGIAVKLVNRPLRGYETWIETQLVSGNPPDIFFSHAAHEYRKRELVVSVDPYLDQINPYSGKKWRDEFVPGILERYTDEINRVNMIPGDIRGYAFYYNQHIFSKVGVEQPKTWSEFLHVCEKIKRAGFIPIACSGQTQGGDFAWFIWGLRGLGDMLMRHMEDELVLYKRDPNWNMNLQDVWNDTSLKISMEDWMLAYIRGLANPLRNPDTAVVCQLLKQLVPYYPPGFLGMTRNESKDLFINGQAAIIYLDTALAYEAAAGMKDLEAMGKAFPINAFAWPALTRETVDRSYLAPPRGQIEVGQKWNIARSTPQRERQAVDFLQFILKNENIEYLQARQTNPNLPPTLSARAQPGVERFRPMWLEHGISMLRAVGTSFDTEAEEKFINNMQLYLLDAISLQELMERAEAEIVPTFRRNARNLGLDVKWVKQQLNENNEAIPEWLDALDRWSDVAE